MSRSNRRTSLAAFAVAIALASLAVAVRAQQQQQRAFEGEGLGVKPLAYFPLVDESLDSFPDAQYKGKVVGGEEGVTWSADGPNDAFPGALECLDHAAGLVQLDTVPYGARTGAFSINMWMKQKPRKSFVEADVVDDDDDDEERDGASGGRSNRMERPLFEYIYSHANSEAEDPRTFFPWTENQIHVFLPTVASPAHGVVRAIVKDSTDAYLGTLSQTFLDSDGRFMDNNPRNMPGHVNLEDEDWHMVTLTTKENAKKGFLLYVDGVLAGEAPLNSLLDSNAQVLDDLEASGKVQFDGGNVLNLTGPIHLCGRVDKQKDRHFGGNLAHLSLWDTALTKAQVADMYGKIMGEAKLRERCKSAEFINNPEISICPFLKSDPAPPQTTPPSSSTSDTQKVATLNDVLGSLTSPVESKEVGRPAVAGVDGRPCSVLRENECGDGSVCIPLKALQTLSEGQVTVGAGADGSSDGQCITEPVGGIFPPDASVSVPLPVAFFPLTGDSTQSWPLGKYSGSSQSVEFVPDIRFEKTLKCSEADGGHVRLPNVKYGTKGKFAINFWMKKDTSDLADNGGFEYIFSHGQDSPTQGSFNPFTPNNVHVYLPEVAHPAHGVARVIVKDSGADYHGLLSHTFFDSDGKFMDNQPRNTIGHVNLEDGNWHMFTLTTKANGEPGYEIFVDGTLGGTFPTPEVENFIDTNRNSEMAPMLHVNGGNADAPLEIDGDIYLCGRADLAQGRHYSGQLAHLEIWDKSLSAEQVAAIFSAVAGQTILVETITDLANSIRALQPNTTEGRPLYYQTMRSVDIINALRAENREGNKAVIAELESNDAITCSIDVEASGIVTPIGCEKEGLVCAALHEDSPLQAIGRNGICVETPEGGTYVPSPQTRLPIPMAYYPLTGGSVETWPEPKSGGEVSGVSWVADPFFGTVLECKENELDYVALDPVDYGKNGDFAINLWMKHNSSSGNTFEFLFSHGDSDKNADPWQPNEVQIYLPEVAHPAHGVIRTIVKDSNDFHKGKLSETFLDSDGGFMNNAPRNVPGHTDLEDNAWHMVTLTTMGEGKKGYAVYVDGILGGTAPPAFAEEIETGISIDGGDVIRPSGKMYLCGRNDLNNQRHFGGRLAHLTFFDEALTSSQIMAMYVAGAGEAAALQRTMALIISQIPNGATSNVNDPLQALNRAKVGEACYLRTGDYDIQQRLYTNSLDHKICVDGAVCAPKANSPAMADTSLGVGGGVGMDYSQALHGQCVEIPKTEMLPELETHDGQMFFPNPLVNVPPPLAFFPLTAGKLDSWPSGMYAGQNRGATWVDDDTFGQVLSCKDDDNAFLALDPVPYAENGGFGVNFWFRNKDSQGSSFEYVYSHSSDDDLAFNPFYPNQLHIYLPEVSHPAHGVIRSILKDSENVYQGEISETFLDSDGLVANNDARDMPGHIDVNDDEWHMVTITTRADGGKGYAIFVDGVLGGANFLPTSQEEAANGKPYQVDGGHPIQLDGHIFLCGRNDGNPERHFRGKLTHLSLYDAPLTPSQIAALFVAVKGEQAYTARLQEIAAATDPRAIVTVPVDETLQTDERTRKEPIILRTQIDPSRPQENQGQEKVSTDSGAVKEQWYTKLTKNLVSDKYKAAFVGVTVILVLVVVAAIVGFIVMRRRSRRPRGPGMVSLPTISRNASIVAATAPQVGEAMSPSPSGEEVTSNPLAERVASVATKMEHKSASKYAEFEDEEV